MDFILGHNEAMFAWVMDKIKHEHYPITTEYTAIGGGKDGKIVVGAIYHDFLRLSYGLECTITVAVDGISMPPAAIKLFFGYPFLQAGCVRVTACVHQDNEASLNVVERLGFTQEGRLRSRLGPDTDVLLFSILKKECRWIPKEHRNMEPLFLTPEFKAVA